VFGLPGNPVSSLVGFELFVRPALLALQGLKTTAPAFRPARLGRATRRTAARDSLLRARSRIEGGEVVLDPLTGQESHMIAQAATADALLLVPRGEGELEAGSPVSYLPL
jgi:molybdopterin molybdotransferase